MTCFLTCFFQIFFSRFQFWWRCRNSGWVLCYCIWSHHVSPYGIPCYLWSCDIDATSSQGPSDTCAAKTVHRDFTSTAKQAIVDKHNELRAKVARGEETNGNQPGASNMKKLVWKRRCFNSLKIKKFSP